LLGDGGDEVVLSGARGLDVFRADFEDFFEVDAHVGEFALEQHYYVLVVLAFLAGDGGVGAAAALDGLEIADLLVEAGEVLLDHVGELGDLDGSVVEEGLALCEFAQTLQFAHCC